MKLSLNIKLVKASVEESPLKKYSEQFFLDQVEDIAYFRKALSSRLGSVDQQKTLFYLCGPAGVGKTFEISRNLNTGKTHILPPFWLHGKKCQLSMFTNIWQKYPVYQICVLEDCHLLDKKLLKNIFHWLRDKGLKIFVISENSSHKHGIQFYENIVHPWQRETIFLPELKNRPNDLRKQIQFYTHKYKLNITDEEKNLLYLQPWKGSSRELRDTLYYLSCLDEFDRKTQFHNNRIHSVNLIYQHLLTKGLDFYLKIYGLAKTQEIFEQEMIMLQCTQASSLKQASHYLKIPPSTLASKIKKHGLNAFHQHRE